MQRLLIFIAIVILVVSSVFAGRLERVREIVTAKYAQKIEMTNPKTLKTPAILPVEGQSAPVTSQGIMTIRIPITPINIPADLL